MKSALGIAAFVLFMISLPVPFVGTYITFLALVIAAGAGLAGEKPFTIATTLLSAIKVYFLSPTWHVALFGASYMHAVNNSSFAGQYGDAGTNSLTQGATHAMAGANAFNHILTITFLGAPIVALLVRNAGETKKLRGVVGQILSANS